VDVHRTCEQVRQKVTELYLTLEAGNST